MRWQCRWVKWKWYRMPAPAARDELRRVAYPGQTMVLFALLSVVLVGFLALAVDAGFYLSERRGVQNAADAAALVAARLRSRGHSESEATSAALAYIADNGYDQAQVEIEFEQNRVTVTVQQEIPPFFIGVLYDGDWTAHAEAVATFGPVASPFALIALGQDPAPGITFSGLNAPQGEIVIQCEPPMGGCGSIGSNSDVTFNGNPSGDVGGNIYAYDELDSIPSSFEYGGEASSGQGLIEDPFAGTPAPECEQDGQITVDEQGRWHLAPGRYERFTAPQGQGGGRGGGRGGGQGGGGGGQRPTEVIFEGPGIFCFEGSQASLDIQQGVPHKSEGGVLLYFTEGATISLQGNRSTDLIVASAGALGTTLGGHENWDEIAIWVDTPPSQCNGAGELRLEGNGEIDIQGAIYAPNTHVTLGGNSGSKTMGGPVIGRCIDIHGSVIFNITIPDEFTADQRQVYLIE